MKKCFGFGLSNLNNNGGDVMFKKLSVLLICVLLSAFGCFNEKDDEPCNGNCEEAEVCVADECETSCTTNNDCFAVHGGGWVCKVVAGVGGYCAVQSSDDDTGVPDNGVPVCEVKVETCDGKDNDCDDKVDEGVKNACGKCGELPKEVCDAKDNDCDGKTDENVTNACGDCGPVPAEVCDGLDNNCNDKIPLVENDEDGDGFMVCEGDCNDLVPEIYPGAKELCNGFDDDCDDEIPSDEADADMDGFRLCDFDCDDNDDARFPGAVELCDGVDEDCDGATDENFYVDVPCLGVGACGAGVYECKSLFGYRCSSMPGASEDASSVEVCGDNIDNDCNGIVDNTCKCDPNDLQICGTTNDGECQQGLQICGANGDWGPCIGSVEPLPELCNGLDDDCDGVVLLEEADKDGDGFRVCLDCDDANAWVYPGAPETCNGVDDDCDGPADEDFAVGVKCTGFGFCGAFPGVYECDGPEGSTCSTMPGMFADKSQTEACSDLIDNDCDGSVDEDCDCQFKAGQELSVKCGSTDVGECAFGKQTCEVDGKLGLCEGAVEPVPELCNGLDDDCDGVVPADEADADGDGFRICESDCDDAVDTVNPGWVEACNGVDDDCDGPADEDYFVGAPCNGEGACGLGKIECAGLDKTVCSTESGGSANEAVPEVCGDSLDNNCDGQANEGCVCQPGQKEPCGTNDNFPCKFGVRECAADGKSWGDCVGNKEPVLETCDGVDTDCDGQLGVGEVDADGDGEMVCQGDCDDANFDINTSVPEICDGVDNDCDDAVDDGFSIDVKCEGKGACGKGVLECNAGLDSQCSTMPGGSQNGATPEAGGDFIDNDCDGSVDEGFKCVYDADPFKNQYLICGTTDVPPCQIGKQACLPTFQWGPCVGAIDPVPEACNGIDDDCDGLINLLGGLEEADTDKDGQLKCGGDCDDAKATVNTKAAEKCNGVDDDCDGEKDEDFLVGASCEGKGACGEGVRECAGDFLWVCSTMPGGSKDESKPESCVDLVDNDCDGLVNEVCDCVAGAKQPCGSSDVLPCQKGVQVCGQDGKWGACVGAIDPVPEVCNDIDDDCDGKLGVDEVDVDDDGEMKCAGDCNDASLFINTNATELCNGGVDDNCDGVKDEGYHLGVPCNAFGACGAGVNECAGTLGYQCSTAPGGSKDGSKPEKCGDFTDNDCDNSVDEGCDCVPGTFKECGTTDVLPCKKGKQTCDLNGKWGSCVGAVEPKPEECNGVDDDCDGALGATEVDADKDGEMICEGDCNDANAKINTGAKEVCNGVDDNCDSAKDEGFFVGAPCEGVGACGQGVLECVALDKTGCTTDPGGSKSEVKAEVCTDLVDNDCDGLVNEGCDCLAGTKQPCGSSDVQPCQKGEQVCGADGKWGTCVGNIEPVAEKCNGLDDDCNGLVPANEADADKDGYRVCENDCNDTNNQVNPGEKEICNNVDDDCDKSKDEDCAFVSCNICCGFGLGHPVVWWGGDPMNSWSGDTGYCGVWTGTVQQICSRGAYPMPGYTNAGWVDWNCQNGNNWGGWEATGVVWCVDNAGKKVSYTVVTGAVDPGGEGEVILLDGICK